MQLAMLPSYRRGADPRLMPLPPGEFLAALGASGAVFPTVPEQVALLLRWVEGVPAFALTYDDTDWAVSAVCNLLARSTP